jgi:hypothetical protein
MESEQSNTSDVAGIGQKLFGHSKAAEFTARRGLVFDLYPFIFGAGERIHGKAISEFLAKEQGVKLSAVTINKALKDPNKNWNLYFDQVESSAWVLAKDDKVPIQELLFREQYFFKPVENRLLKAAVRALVKDEIRYAASILRTKWFSIDWEIRLKARPYLEHRFSEKGKK